MKLKIKKTGIAFLLIASFSSNSITAQTFTWGNANASNKEDQTKLKHIVDSKFYQINSWYNEKVFNRDVTASTYNLSNLNKEKSNDVSVEKQTFGYATLTHLNIFEEKGANCIIFLDDFNSKTKERELYFQKVNIETNEKTKPALITSMPGRNSTYFVTQSPNKKFYAVIKQYTLDKKANEKINVTLIDNNFNVVKEISFETPYINKTPYENNIYVSNQGTVFVIKNTDVAKAKPFKTLYFWDGNSTTMQETSLKFENDYQIYDFQGHFDGDDFYIHGVYTRIGSKGVQIYGGGLPAAGFYAARFASNGEKKYIVANDTEEIPNLNLKDFVFDGMKTWVFADKMFVLSKNKPPVPGGSFNFEKDYTYSNTGIVFGKLDNQTGKLEWSKILKFQDPDTMNDNGRYLSYVPLLFNNQLTILYNDVQKTKYNGYLMDKRFITMEKFDDRGNSISNSILAETGLEYNGGENFDLDTSTAVKFQDGKFILRGKSASSEKYGYIKL
jgi:hypothetical protein